MHWPTVAELARLVPLPAGYAYEQLRRADVPELIAAIERWHPDIRVGAGSAYLRPAFYDEKVTLAGEAERDTYAVVFRHQGAMAGVWSWDREPDALTIYGRLLVVAPEHRGSKIAASAMLGTERLARQCGAEFMYVMATLKVPHMAMALERAGYHLLGFLPGYDREVVADGTVRRVFEAVYAKVLVPESALLRPDPAQMTPRARALFEATFPPGAIGDPG
ncbi:MAG: GNAT family N-acetyltransferase [Burkholderiales bacterium]